MSASPTTPSAPAGWYRDPLGIPQLRWWNGTSWTNHIQEPRVEFQSWDDQPVTSPNPSVTAEPLIKTYTVA